MSLCWNNDTKHTNTRKDQVMERLMGKLSRETHNRERKNKTKLSQSVGKVKASVFWDAKEVLLVDYPQKW